MEKFTDLIVPLIFLAVFVLNTVFKSDKDKENQRKSPLPPIQNENDPLTQLREEIRKRIEENQRQSQSPAPTGPAQHPARKPIQRVYGPTSTTAGKPQPSIPLDANVGAERMYEMQRMQHQVAEMQRRAAIEKQKAANLLSGSKQLHWHPKATSVRRTGRHSLVTEVVRDLKQAGSSRKAIMNAEILGTPVGLRRSQGGREF